MLEKLNCSIAAANNGHETLQAAENSRFDLILMACQMPEMDGFTATRAVRKREQDGETLCTTIGMTAHALEGSETDCLDTGMDDHVSKPVTLSTLKALLDNWARRL